MRPAQPGLGPGAHKGVQETAGKLLCSCLDVGPAQPGLGPQAHKAALVAGMEAQVTAQKLLRRRAGTAWAGSTGPRGCTGGRLGG